MVGRTLVFGFFLLVASSPVYATESLDDARGKLDQFLSAYVACNTSAMLRQIETGSMFRPSEKARWPVVVQQIDAVFNVEGRPLQDHELVDGRLLGGRLALLRYVVALESAPLVAEFVVYRPDERWVILNFSLEFGAKSLPLIRDWAGESNE